MEKFDFVRSLELGLGFSLGVLIILFVFSFIMPMPIKVQAWKDRRLLFKSIIGELWNEKQKNGNRDSNNCIYRINNLDILFIEKQ